MNFRSSSVLSVLCLVFGIAIGWFLRGFRQSSDHVEPELIVTSRNVDSGADPRPGAEAKAALRRLVLEAPVLEGNEPTRDFFALVRRLGEASAAEVQGLLREVLEKIPKSDAESVEAREGAVVGTLLQRLAEADPSAATEFLAANESFLSRVDSLGPVLVDLAEHGGDALRAVSAKLHHDRLLRPAQEAWLGHLIKSDPPAAVAFLNQMREAEGGSQENPLEPQLAGEFAERIAGAWVQKDAPAAAKGCLTFANESDRTAALEVVLRTWDKVSPGSCQKWADSLAGKDAALVLGVLLGRQQDRSAAAIALAKRFATLKEAGEGHANYESLARKIVSSIEDGSEALEIIKSLPDGVAKSAATEELASLWPSRDPAAASAWIATLPENSAKNRGIENLVKEVRGSDPSAALKWAQKHPEENVRLSLMTSAMESWMELAKEQADAALRALPPEMGAAIQDRLERRRRDRELP